MSRVFPGGCHCRNLEFRFETATAPERLSVRACGCSFCSRHGARTASDPEGRVRIIVHDASALIRYRFALKTAEFLVCGRCGIYVAAVAGDAAARHAIINLNTLDDADLFTHPPAPMNYDAESEQQRRDRRAARWTPAEEYND